MLRHIAKFSFSSQQQPLSKARKRTVTALLLIAPTWATYHLGYLEWCYNKNLFLDCDQVSDLHVKNQTTHKDEPLQGHPVNTVNGLRSGQKAIIVGGGIIGITQAWKLLREGYCVTILDSAESVATECSAFNGNVFNPLYFLPLVTFDNLKYMIKNFFTEPTKTVVRLNPNAIYEKNFITFSINALYRSMTSAAQLHNSRCQLKIGRKTLDEIEVLRPTGVFKGGHLEAKGQLGFFATDEKVNAYGSRLDLLGIPHLKVEDFSQLEKYLGQGLRTAPNLKLFERYKRALVLITESNLETKVLCNSMLEYLEKNYPQQFSICYKTTADKFVLQDKVVKGVSTNQGVVLGDLFILCAAHKTKYLSELLRVTLPIVPAKGWTLGAQQPLTDDLTLIRNFTLNTPNFFATITMNKLRLAGCAEICKDVSSQNAAEEWGAIQILQQFNAQTGYDLKMDQFQVRSCFRPLTPDDVAIICRLAGNENVYINAGHGSRGMSYCFGAAEILSQIIQGSKDYSDFSYQRFILI